MLPKNSLHFFFFRALQMVGAPEVYRYGQVAPTLHVKNMQLLYNYSVFWKTIANLEHQPLQMAIKTSNVESYMELGKTKPEQEVRTLAQALAFNELDCLKKYGILK